MNKKKTKCYIFFAFCMMEADVTSANVTENKTKGKNAQKTKDSWKFWTTRHWNFLWHAVKEVTFFFFYCWVKKLQIYEIFSANFYVFTFAVGNGWLFKKKKILAQGHMPTIVFQKIDFAIDVLLLNISRIAGIYLYSFSQCYTVFFELENILLLFRKYWFYTKELYSNVISFRYFMKYCTSGKIKQ